MNFRMEVCSYSAGSRWPGLAKGEITHVGTRIPIPYASTYGGRTWSKNPPPSSYVWMYAELAHADDCRSAVMSSF